MDDDQTDFIARYPVNLQKIAARNLGAEDASVGRFNAANRTIDPWTGYSQVSRYQEPGTEATTRYVRYPLENPTIGIIDYNAGTATGKIPSVSRPAPSYFGRSTPNYAVTHATPVDDIPDDHPLAEPLRRADMISKGIDPDAPAIYPSRQRPFHGGPSRWEELQHEAQQTYHDNAAFNIAQARDSHHALGAQMQGMIAAGNSKLFQSIAQLGQQYGIGTPEFERGMITLFQSDDPEIAAARGSPNFVRLFKPFAEAHDASKRLAPEDKRYDDSYRQAFKDASEFARTTGVDVQYNSEGFPSIEETRRYAEEKGIYRRPTETKPNAALAKEMAELAGLKAEKDNAYNADNKADMTPYDRDIAVKQARVDAMKEALGVTDSENAEKVTDAPLDATKRTANTVYQTPKGPMKWTGTGWVPQ